MKDYFYFRRSLFRVARSFRPVGGDRGVFIGREREEAGIKHDMLTLPGIDIGISETSGMTLWFVGN